MYEITRSIIGSTREAAIVAGGAKGIGYGIAYRLAEAGAREVLSSDIVEV